MKKVSVLFVAAVLTANVATGQFSVGGKDVRIGARAGVNFTKYVGSDAYLLLEQDVEGSWGFGVSVEDTKSKMAFKPGIQLGAVANVALSEVLSFQPGLLLSQMGLKTVTSLILEDQRGGDFEVKTTVSQTLNYIQMPLNFQYKNNYGNQVLWLQAGPYVGLGVGTSSKIKTSVTDGGKKETDSDSATASFDDLGLNVLDFGVGLGIGLEIMGMIQVGVVSNLGITNLAEKVSLKNKGLFLTTTYFFGK